MHVLKRAAVAAALMLAGAAAAAEVPIRDFAREADYQDAKISPDGKYLAVSKWLGDGLGLAFIDLESRKVTGTMRLVRGDSPEDFEWVGPTRVIIPIKKRLGPLDQFYLTGEIVAINADGSGMKYLFGSRAGGSIGTRLQTVERELAFALLVDPLPHDPDYALVSVWPWDKPMDRTFPFVDRINVNTGARSRVSMVPSYGAGVIADESGQPRFGTGARADGTCCELVAAPKGSSSWKTLPARTGDVELLSVSRDGASAYFLTEEDGDKASCLREYVFARDEVRTVHCDATVEMDALLSADRRPIALRREAGKPQTTYLDVADPGIRMQKSLENSFKGQRVTITSRTLDGSKSIVLVESDRSPGDVYLFDSTRKKVDQIMALRSWIDPAAMQPMEPFDYKARDGKLLHGYVTAPGGLAARKLPMVVMPHGGPHQVRDYWGWDPEAQLLASRGYAVLQVNYRGSAGFGWEYERAGYKKWGTAMQDDLTDGVKWAIDQGIADPGRICIYGGSYGGYAALMSATREPDLYRCAVGFAGVYDLATQSQNSDIADSWLGLKYLQEVLSTDPKELLAQSPVAHVGKLKAPVLIVHGTADRRVPFSQAKQLRAALDQAGKPYEWLEFPGEEHGLWLEANREQFYARLLEFLGKHIGGGTPPAPAVTSPATPSGG